MNASRRTALPACTPAELDALEQQAMVNNDRFTIAEVQRARKGDQVAMIACAMCLGR